MCTCRKSNGTPVTAYYVWRVDACETSIIYLLEICIAHMLAHLGIQRKDSVCVCVCVLRVDSVLKAHVRYQSSDCLSASPVESKL